MSVRRRGRALLVAFLLVLTIGHGGATASDEPDGARHGISAAAGTCRHGRVALTFDDGPRQHTTGRLLRILHRRHAPATFFVQGHRVRAHPSLIRRMARQGHVVGNHTWNHKQLTGLSARRIRSQLVRTNRAIRRAGAPRPTLMRPPYGSTDDRVRRVAGRLELTEVLWTIDTRNWSGIASATIAHRVLSGIRRGPNIVLLHDGVAGSSRTVRAVPRIIRGIRHLGYCVAPVGRNGHPRKPGR